MPAPPTPHSDFIIYDDESGDHGLKNVDPENPFFVFVLCIFEKREYSSSVSSRLQQLKFQYFGHDLVIIHNYEIRKAKGEFTFLRDANIRPKFLSGISNFVKESPFTVIAAAIDKARLQRQYAYPGHPYEIALLFCLERAYAFLKDQNQENRTCHVIVESRGRHEDRSLELEFRRICDGANYWGRLPFEIVFAQKSSNSAGLQLADLIAYPIRRYVSRPDQPNRAFEIIKPKIRTSPKGKVEGWGLKFFP